MTNDKEKFREAIDLNMDGKYKQAIEILEKLLKIHENNNDNVKIIDVLHQLAQNNLRLGNFDLSDDLIKKSIAISEKIDDIHRLSISYNLLATNLTTKGNYEEAIGYLEKSREIKEKLEDIEGLGIIYSKMGSILMHKNKLDEAKWYLEKSLKINEENNDSKGIAVNLSQLGSIYQYQTYWDKARDMFQKSLKIKKKIGDKYGMGISYNQLGIIYQFMDEWDKALENYEKSIAIKRKINDFIGIIKSYISLGDMEFEMGNLDKSIDYFTKSKTLAKENGLKSELANSLIGLAKVLVEKKEYGKVRPLLEESIEISRQLEDQDNVGQALLLLAMIEKNQEKAMQYYQEAYKIGVDNDLIFLQINSLILNAHRFNKEDMVNILQSALSLAELVDDKQLQSRILRELGEHYNSLCEYDRAKAYYDDSIKVGQGFERIKTISDISILDIRRGNWDRAFSSLEKVYEESMEKGQVIHASLILQYLGLLLQYQGRYADAEEYYQKSLEINKKYDPARVAGNLGSLGMLSLKTSNFDKALKYFRESLKLNMQNANRFGIAITLNQIGQVYNEKAQHKTALEYFAKSMRIKKFINDKIGVTISLNAIGSIYLELNEYQKSLEHFQKSLQLKQEIEDIYGIGRVHGNIAKVYIEMGEYSKAKKHQNEALKIAEKLGDKESLLYGTYYSGIVELYMDKLEKALTYFKESQKIASENNDLMAVGMSLSKIAEIEYKNNNLIEAKKLFVESIKSFDEVSLRIRKSSDRISLSKYYYPIFGTLCSVLIDCKEKFEGDEYLQEAIGYAELGKSRELLSSINLKTPKDEKYLESINKLNSMKEQIFILQNQFNENLIDPEYYKKNIEKSKNEIRELEEFLWENFPDPRDPPPENPEIILKRFIKIMKPYKNWAVLEYIPDLENNRLNIFLIGESEIKYQTATITFKEYILIKQELNIILNSFHTKNPDQVNKLVEKLTIKLSSLLIPTDFYDDLKNSDLVIFIPQGTLHNVPFELLLLDNNHIGQIIPVTRSLSLDILRSSIETEIEPNKEVLIIGNPNKNQTATGELIGMSSEYSIELGLPFAENEAMKIEKLLSENNYKTNSFFSKDATEDAFIKNTTGKSLIHFAGHSVFIGEMPELSFLLFNGPEKFTASEITANLNLKSALVVLSACQSGTSKILSGDEVFGVVRSLILAGADTLVISIWPVFDVKATEVFMIEIYKNLISNQDISKSIFNARKQIKENIEKGIYESDTKSYQLLLWGTFFVIGNPYISF